MLHTLEAVYRLYRKHNNFMQMLCKLGYCSKMADAIPCKNENKVPQIVHVGNNLRYQKMEY